MTRALVLVLALGLAVASGLGSGSGPSAVAQAPGGKPNLLVIMTDDLEIDDLKALPSDWHQGAGSRFAPARAT